MTTWTDGILIDGIELQMVASETGIRQVQYHPARPPQGRRDPANPLLLEAEAQLRAYFAGELRKFDLPLDLAGTDFQLRVWRQLLAIPYGQTRTYLEIARAIGSPGAVRAVGAANGANPLAIVVPCHRAIGDGGKLVGYSGGLALKKRLLDLERGADLFE